VVAVGGDKPAAGYTSTGTGWSNAANSSALDSTVCCGGKAVAYSVLHGRFVAVSDNGVNTIAYSDDGRTWVGLGTSVFGGFQAAQLRELS
jgi:hypothetical protein